VLRSALLESCKDEQPQLLCLLAAVGVLRLHERSHFTAGADVLRKEATEDGAAAAVAALEAAGSLELSADPVMAQQQTAVDFHAFAMLYGLLSSSTGGAFPLTRDFVLKLSFCTLLLPAGSFQPVRSALDVYHHWHTVVLPSLPIDWTGLRFGGPMPNLAMHILHYWEKERPTELPAGTPRAQNRALFYRGKVRMDIWGCAPIRAAWEQGPELPWTTLQGPAASAGREAAPQSGTDTAEATLFSLDMPRKASAVKARRGTKRSTEAAAAGGASSPQEVGSTGAASGWKKRRQAGTEGGIATETAPFEGVAECDEDSEGEAPDEVAAEWEGWDSECEAQLREELGSLGQDVAGDGGDWTTAQVCPLLCTSSMPGLIFSFEIDRSDDGGRRSTVLRARAEGRSCAESVADQGGGCLQVLL
jgi:hypothetical protein